MDSETTPKRTSWVLALLFCSCLSTIAFANSHRRFAYGDEAAMSGRANPAVVRDTGAIWYNPAGLGGNNYQKLHVSGTVYSVQMRHLDNILRTDLGAQTHRSNESINAVGVVPSALSFAFQLSKKVSLGVGLFQTENNSVHLHAVQQVYSPALQSMWNTGVEYHEQSVGYAFGPALGVKLNSKLKWGIAFFGLYESLDASLRIYAGFDRSNSAGVSDLFALDSQYVTSQQVAAFVTTGVQWQISDRFHTGLLMRTPVVRLWSSLSASKFDAETIDAVTLSDAALNSSETISVFEYDEQIEAQTGMAKIEPMELQWSAVYHLGQSWIGTAAAYQFGLKKENQQAVFNVNLGAHIAVAKRMGLGIGFFTDNDSQINFDGTLIKPGQRYGVDLGFQFSTAELVKQISSSNASQKQKQRRRVLLTTVAVSYSMQMVQYQAMHFAVNEQTEQSSFEFGQEDAIFHRLELHVGGGFYF